MRKFLLLSAGLLTLGCLIIPVVFSQSANMPKELSSDEFKQEVARLHAAAQSKLDAAIAKLLGSTQSTGAPPAEESAPPQKELAAPPPPDTGASENNSSTSSSSPGLNMYQQ